MGKIILSFVLFITLINTAFAQGLELSDVIKNARENVKSEQIAAQNQNSIKPVKNTQTSASEQEISEKINPDEILNNSNVKK